MGRSAQSEPLWEEEVELLPHRGKRSSARLQASNMRLGSGRASQFGSCPKLPTWTKPTPLSLAHSFKPRSMAIILLSNSGAGSAILGGSFILFRLGIALPTA